MKESTKAKIMPLFATLFLCSAVIHGYSYYEQKKKDTYIRTLESENAQLEYNFKLCKFLLKRCV